MRTWIYVAPDDRSTKLGYLRAGAIVDRAEEPTGTTHCAGGWDRLLGGCRGGGAPSGSSGRSDGGPGCDHV